MRVQCVPTATPTPRGLASHTVFNLTFNLFELALTSTTLYHQYLYTVESNIVPDDKLISLTFSPLQCTFVRDKRCAILQHATGPQHT